MKSYIHLLLVLVLLHGCSSQGQSPPRTRQAFAQAMQGIEEGMSEREVTRLLGEPDDIRTEGEVPNPAHVFKILCYGTEGHMTFPTRGQVYLNHVNKVVYRSGNEGTPPPASLIDETELQALLRLLDASPPLRGNAHDPLIMIQIVNELHRLGKTRALAVI